MKLYKAYNGWLGESAVHCLVLDYNEQNAKIRAQAAFKAKALKANYPPRYYDESEITVELIFEDTSMPQCSNVSDG
ncbi:MAG: hypothetical protein WBV94_25155 [Blastocatellia bacterium]